jgi:hypothetical protein
MRKRRAAAKTLKTPPDTPRAISAPMTLPTIQKAVPRQPAKLGKSKTEATRRRDRIVEYLADCLTRTDCPIDAADFGHFRIVGELFGAGEALSRIETAYADKPQVKAEVLLGLLVGCLDRLV